MNERRKFLIALAAMMMPGTTMATEQTLATVYLNPT